MKPTAWFGLALLAVSSLNQCPAEGFILAPHGDGYAAMRRTGRPRHLRVDKTPSTRSQTTQRQTTSSLALNIFGGEGPGGGSLIASTDPWGNWMILLGNAALAQVLGKRTAVGRLLGPPVTAMALTFGMATIGVLPAGGTLASKSLQTLSLQLATPLVLLGADLRNALQRCGPLLVSFLWAASATLIACLVGWNLLGGALLTAFGSGNSGDGLIIAAALMAKNIGGGLNYMAVCSSLNASPTAIAAGLCIDNIFALIYFPATSYLASGRPDPGATGVATTTTTTTRANATTETNKDDDKEDDLDVVDSTSAGNDLISIEHVTTVLFLSATLLWLGQQLGGPTGALPVCTLLTVLLAGGKVVPRSRRRWNIQALQPSSQVLGTVALYVFFSTAGAPGLAVADSVKASIVPLGLFLTCLYSIHGLILWAAHAVFANGNNTTSTSSSSSADNGGGGGSLAPQRLLCASSAAIGGPATAVALAQAAEWESLKVPSLLVGNLGYAVATFLGLAYHALFSSS